MLYWTCTLYGIELHACSYECLVKFTFFGFRFDFELGYVVNIADVDDDLVNTYSDAPINSNRGGVEFSRKA
jgi:hypothetical protein